MKLTKQDLMRLSKERLAEIILEMQEQPTLTTPSPNLLPYVSENYCSWYGAACPFSARNCLTCPYKQVSATTEAVPVNEYQPSQEVKATCIYNDGDFCKKGLPDAILWDAWLIRRNRNETHGITK